MRAWRNSFVTRYTVLSASLIIGVVLISGWLRDRATREYFLQDQRRHLLHRLEIIRVRLNSAIDGIRKDVLYFSESPSLARLARARSPEEIESAEHDAGVHFRGGLQARPSYFEERLIGVSDGGRELIRFDQSHGRIVQTPSKDLRPQAAQDFFRETMKLPVGKLCFSEFNLYRDSSRLNDPVPSLNASTPVSDNNGHIFGLVIVKVNAAMLFDELRALAGPDVILTLSNSQGDYLLHPDPTKCFAFERGKRFNLFEDHPTLRQGPRQARFEDGPLELSLTDELPFTWECDRSLILRLALPKDTVLASIQTRRAENLFVTLGMACIAGSVIFLITNLFARNLHRVAEAVGHYEPGKPFPLLPPESSDEVGMLTSKFKQMAGKISEQMQGLQEARERAEQAVRAREQFLATMSHEIRTPMNAVLGITHLLENDGVPAHQTERLRTLKSAGRYLMTLLNNLLDRERIESGEIVFDPLEFDLRELVENVHLSLEPLASRKQLGFLLAFDPNLPRRVTGDPVRIYQVLNNLAQNAIKFTEHGQVLLKVHSDPDNQVTFEISDTGPGLPGPVLEFVGSPHCTTITTGLGLSISRRLIELLGGRLRATSSPAGSKFFFSLCLPVAGVNLIPQSTEDRPDLAGYSALLVEDVPSNQTVLTALLVRIGMTSDLACTAAQAREKLQTNRYDFAFVDIQLPDLNGDALARQMREIQPDLKIIAVTAQVSSEIRAACESAGVDAFVPKPIAPSELYEKLRKFTAPSVNALEMLFDYDANKVSQYLAQLDQEQQVWQEELREIVEAPDPNALGRLHHRMKTALGQLQLWKLDRILTELRESLDRGDSTQSQVLCGNALRQLAKLKLIGKRFSLPA